MPGVRLWRNLDLPATETGRVACTVGNIRTRTLLATGAGAGVLTALVVPTIQALVVWRTARPPVPGPHEQNGTVGTDGRQPVSMVWLGDSLASGVGANTADAAFPRQAAELYCQMDQRSVRLTCLARPGACAADVLAEQVPAAVAHLGPGSMAVVAVGSNDVGSLTRPRRFRQEYASILQALVATGATVVAIGMPDIGAAKVIPHPLRYLAGWVGRNADRAIQGLAASHGVHFVDIDTRPPRGTKAHVYLAADRYHPNNDTYRLWAHNFAAKLRPVLQVGTA